MKLKKISNLIFFVLVFIFTFSYSYAGPVSEGGTYQNYNAPATAQKLVENTNDDFFTFLTRIKDYLLLASGAIATLFIVLGGLMYITSSGDPKRVDQAKNTLKYAVLGLIFVIVSEVVLGLLSGSSFTTIFK